MGETNLPPIPDDWTRAHSLAFLYIMFAGFTDGRMDPGEASVIRGKLADWEIDLDALLPEVERFAAPLDGNQIVSCLAAFCAIIARELPKPQLRAIYRDLVSISRADGEVVDAEMRWLEIVERTFEV